MKEKIKKPGWEKRLNECQEWQEKLESDYSALKTKRTDARLFLDADPTIVAIIKNRSKITTTDMQDAIDMAKPDILETIAGIDEPLKLEPGNAQVVDRVKKLQVLGNVMVKRKNAWFRVCSDFLDDSMGLQFGCIKYRWVEEEKITEKEYENLDDVELQAFIANGAELVSDEKGGDGEDQTRKTVISYKTKDEYVRYDVVPSERIKFPLDTQDFSNTPIVIETVCLYEHEFIQNYGQDAFDKVKEAKEKLDSESVEQEFADRFKHVGGLNHVYDKKSGKYLAYECYPWNGQVPWVMTFAAKDVVLQDEKNKYGKPPYRGGSPFLVAHSLIGKGYYDCLKEIQRQNTNTLRNITDIITQSCHRRNYVNPEAIGLNFDDYQNNGAMDALIRFTGYMDDSVFRPEENKPLGGDILNFWEMLQIRKDAHIPTPRSYAGLEGSADERTYRGQQLKVNQASKKLLMMMRTYMEEVFAPLFQDTLDCIAKFMKKNAVVRYLNEDYDISPEDIVCEYALVVNVGLGSHDKQDLIVKLQQLIGLAMQQMAFGIITPQNLYYMNQELVKAMGFLNTMDFVTDPKLKETVLQFIQGTMTAMQHFTEMHGQEPEMQAVAQQMMAMTQQVMAVLGIQQPKQKDAGGENSQGTQPGQKPAEIPGQIANPMNPQTMVSGGNFFA
jgi:hypothetical protein